MFYLAPPHLVDLVDPGPRYHYGTEPELWIAVGEWIALATQRTRVLHLVDRIPETWSRETRVLVHPRGEPPAVSAIVVARLA